MAAKVLDFWQPGLVESFPSYAQFSTPSVEFHDLPAVGLPGQQRYRMSLIARLPANSALLAKWLVPTISALSARSNDPVAKPVAFAGVARVAG